MSILTEMPADKLGATGIELYLPRADGGTAEPPKLATGRVVGCAEDHATFSVEVSGVVRQAKAAIGCLIRPIAEDRVLVLVGGDEVFVLNVLERAAPNYATLALPGPGNLAVEGETVTISAVQRLALRGPSTDIRTKMLTVLAEQSTWLGKVFTSVVERWRASSKTHDVSADTHTIKAVDRVAIVDSTDSVQAGIQVVKVAGMSTETAHSKVVSVSEDLRFDGKRVSIT